MRPCIPVSTPGGPGSRIEPDLQRAAAQSRRGDALRIAVCSQNRKTVTEHAGKCRKFWIFEVRQRQMIDKTLLELPIEQSLHAVSGAQAHPLDSVDVLLTAGMGPGLRQRLRRRGVDALLTAEADPDLAVAAYLTGETQARPDAQTRG
jgi:predicted Fe-Mo cluster-binding NifX family protein